MAVGILCFFCLAQILAEALHLVQHADKSETCVLDRLAKLGIDQMQLEEEMQDHGITFSNVSFDLCDYGDADKESALAMTNRTMDNGLVPDSSRPHLPKKRTKPFIWIHTPNAGGTFICAGAFLNKEKVVKPSDTCNWLKHDVGRGSVYSERTTCDERFEYADEHGYTWGHIERTLYDSLCFKNFDYGFWMRDPLSLAEAEVNHNNYTLNDVKSHMECFKTTCYQILSKDEVPLWMYFDNFIVRTLGGRDAFNTAPGNISKEQYMFAKLRLSKFKVALAMEPTLSHPPVLLKDIGWKWWPMKNMTYNPSGKENLQVLVHLNHTVKFNLNQRSRIKKQNKYDYMLYQWLLKGRMETDTEKNS